MANTASALKNIRIIKRRTSQNNFWRVKIKKALKDLRLNKDESKVEKLSREAQSIISKAAKKGVLHKNKAARLVAKLFRK
ncbi:MAG: 30S ribosomal protein S20 [Patescibacteria group bacterium]|nr:30S ribosomal protein S20 [Patescibacteria group bacterium]